eukprot:4361406-Pyramimonas_sp.AAC.1
MSKARCALETCSHAMRAQENALRMARAQQDLDEDLGDHAVVDLLPRPIPPRGGRGGSPGARTDS